MAHFSDIPMGALSEEALESCHKLVKSYRANFSRKFSREETNIDIFRRLLFASDPVIFYHRNHSIKQSDYTPEAFDMFLFDVDNADEIIIDSEA